MLTSPYNFVPLNSKVYLPDWSDKVSQDIPFEDGEDGYIEVTWHNYSPLFIRNEDKNNPDPIHINGNGNRRYFIPGSSIKGMLRNTLSILAFGKMAEGEQYNDRFFGHREFDTRLPEGRRYKENMAKVKYGWLEKDNEDYWLYPCKGDAEKISVVEVVLYFCLNADRPYYMEESAWKRNELLSKRKGWFPEVKRGDKTYRLFATGKFGNENGKKNELLIPDDTEPGIMLPKENIDEFLSVYEPTPGFNETIDENGNKKGFMSLLNKGKEIPVSYIEECGKIVAIGMGRMIRYPYKYGVKDLVEKEQNPEAYKDKRDLCDTIFGHIDDKNSLKGRIQIGNAWSDKPITSLKEQQTIVLGQPQASYYPLYVKQDISNGKYHTYEDDASRISGRKRYRIHKENNINLTSVEKSNVTTSFKAIPAGQDFTMRINLHNLRAVEIGALLSAITLHKTDGVYHNIGAAKSFGYGKIKADKICLHGLSRSIDEFIAEFEIEIGTFTKRECRVEWCQSPQVTRLLGIMSEHANKDELKMMTLEGENTYSDNAKVFQVLPERSIQATTFISPAVKFEHENKPLYDEIKASLYSDNKTTLNGALNKIESLINQKRLRGISFETDETLRNSIKEKIQNIEDAENAEAERIAEQKRQEDLARPLRDILEEKMPNGQYKVKEWKVCKQRVDQYLRDHTMTEDDREALCVTVRRLSENPSRDERRSNAWAKRDSNVWKGVESYLGKEATDRLFDEINTK